MKIFPPLLVVVFWISSWFPTSPGRGATFLAVFCILGLMAAHLAPKSLGEGGWLSKALAAFALVVLAVGALLALMTWIEGSSADGAITLFFVLGFAGYFLMAGSILASCQSFRGYRVLGGMILVVISLWSWTSAIGMYAHRGAEGDFKDTCILVSNPTAYDTQLSSIWEMRLPEVVSRSTSPAGSYIWEYHAILVAKSDGRTEHYNWSKKWMRFDRLDAMRNPYLPTTCP